MEPERGRWEDEDEFCCLIQKLLSPLASRFTFEKQRHITWVGDRNQGCLWMQGLSSFLTHLNHACLQLMSFIPCSFHADKARLRQVAEGRWAIPGVWSDRDRVVGGS